jgi:hypothetical protein
MMYVKRVLEPTAVTNWSADPANLGFRSQFLASLPLE